ncbi:MAG: hypothetical protein JWL61_5333 [Gemmatimonadetes bacterium]|jgi:hypothetical protein|nr:hypothetical protein [Gemmatimonadota bacterium]
MTEPTTHSWAVDSIQEGVARVEEDGERMISVPAKLLPPGVTEGQLLRVTRAPDREAKVLTIVIDTAGTEKAHRRSSGTTAAAMAESKKKDRGGDVAL